MTQTDDARATGAHPAVHRAYNGINGERAQDDAGGTALPPDRCVHRPVSHVGAGGVAGGCATSHRCETPWFTVVSRARRISLCRLSRWSTPHRGRARPPLAPAATIPAFAPGPDAGCQRHVASALAQVRNNYSQFPVYSGDAFQGLLTENGITRWLARAHAGHETSIVDLEEERVDAVLALEEARESWAFVCRCAPIDKVFTLFLNKPLLEAVRDHPFGAESQVSCSASPRGGTRSRSWCARRRGASFSAAAAHGRGEGEGVRV